MKKDKNAIFSNAPSGRFAPFGILSMFIQTYLTALTERVACSVELGCVKTCSVVFDFILRFNMDKEHPQKLWQVRTHPSVWTVSAVYQAPYGKFPFSLDTLPFMVAKIFENSF